MAKGGNEAGSSKPPIVDQDPRPNKRKQGPGKKSLAKPTNPTPGSNSTEPSKSKAEKNKEKFKEWRDRKRKKARTTQHAETVPSESSPPVPAIDSIPFEPNDDMAVEVLFTTMTGKVVTSQNLGIVLTRYLQSFHNDPAKFVAKTEYTLIPPSDLADRKWKQDPNHSHQPPPDSLYQCQISLPSDLKIQGVTSTPPGFRSKALAKRDATAVMVKALMEAGEIDEDLEPKPTEAGAKVVGAKDRKDLAWFEKQEKLGKIGTDKEIDTSQSLNQRWAAFKSGIRDRLPPLPQTVDGRQGVLDVIPISSPDFWTECPPFTDSPDLYPTIITMSVEGSTEECRGMCLVTTRPIPETESGLEVDLSVRKVDQPFVNAAGRLESRPALNKISATRIEAAFHYTHSLLNAHLARPVTSTLAECRWLLLPLQHGYEPAKHPTIKRKHIDWEQVEAAENAEPTPLAVQELPESTMAMIEDSMFETADSSRLVFLRPARSAGSTTDDHTNYQTAKTADNQLVEGIVAMPGRKGGFVNQLSCSRDVLPNLRDLRSRHPIPASIYRTTSMLPDFLNHLDTNLIARQLSDDIFASTISTSMALKSITPRKTSGDLHHSYERLEFLGDTLLKLIATIDVFARPPDGRHELEVEKDRHMMLSNRMLQMCAGKAGVTPYIRNERFKTSTWMPTGWTFEGEQTPPRPSQVMGLKVVADVAEALIAAAYLSQSRSLDSAITAIRTLNLPLAAVHRWQDAAIGSERNNEPESTEAATEPGWMGALTKQSLKVFDYQFKQPKKGQIVLNQVPDPGTRDVGVKYKLLGNAILEYFVIEGMWDRYPEAGPPAMTVMKHSRVGDMNLSALCAVSPVFDQLVIPQALLSAYRKYRKLALAAKTKADQEIAAAATEPGWNAEANELSEIGKEWWSDIGHTHHMGNVIEGLMGAILEDSGYDIEVCRDIYTKHILPHFDKYCLGPHEESQNPKDRLHKIMSMRKCQHFAIRKDDLNAKSGEYEATILIHGTYVGKGSGPWQELAIRRACAAVMGEMKQDEAWLDAVCDCRKEQSMDGEGKKA